MKKQRPTTTETRIPQEIIEEILSRLPVKTLMRFRSVCKSWNNLVSESRFSNLHLQRSVDRNRTKLTYSTDCYSTLAYEAMTGRLTNADDESAAAAAVLAYCDGLFCISIAEDILLWNPATKKSRKIPTSPIEFPTTRSATAWASVFFGLGHHSPSDDYKLVRISMFDDQDSFRTEVKIYSRNSDTWKRVEDFPYDYPLGGPGVFAGGCLHWIVSMWEGDVHLHRVALLDLADDSYGLIRLPDFESRNSFFDIGSLHDKLVVFYSPDIWILREHRREETWTKIKLATDWVGSRLEAFIYFQPPLCVLKPDQIMIIRLGAKTVVFDVEEMCCYDIHAPHFLDCRMISFVDSLVSPNARM